MDLPDLRGRVRVDTSDLDSAVSKASKSGSLIGSALGTIGGGVALGGIGLAAGALKSLTSDSITAASDLGETANKITTIFGPGADALNEFAKTADTKLGLSQQAALDAAATFGVFGKSAGLTGPKLSAFSGDLVGLASDLASFNNTSPEQAIEALGSALRGESEPMRAYGVLMDDASLRAEALKQGLIKTTKEALTPQAKVLAAQGLIMKQTALAQGDFGKTSDGLANRQRIAAAQFQNLQTKLGQGLLPVVNSIMGAFVKFIPVLTSVAETVGNTIGPALTQVGSIVSGLFSGGGGVSSGMSSLGAAVGTVRTAFAAFMPTVIQFAQTVLGAVVPVLRDLVGIIVTNIIPAVADLIAALLPVIGVLYRTLGPPIVAIITVLGTIVRGVFTLIGNIIRTVAAILHGDWGAAWEGIKSILTTALSTIVNALRGILSGVIPAIMRGAGSLLASLWNATLGRLVSAAGEKIGQIAGTVRSFFTSTIPGLIRSGGSAIAGIWSRAMEGLRSTAARIGGNVVSFFRGLPGTIVGALGNLPGLLLSAGGDLVGGLISGIQSRAGEVIDTIKGWITDRIPQFIKDALGISSPSKVTAGLGEELPAGMGLGIRRNARSATDAARRLAEDVAGAFGTPTLAVPPVALTGASGGPGGALQAVDLSPATLGALARLVTPGVVQVLLDGRVLAEAVDRRLGATADDLLRGALA